MTPTANTTNVDVVVFALADLGGTSRSVHLEDISVRAAELSPGAFRWDRDKYADRVDKDKVRVSLTDAQKDKYGGLVSAVGAKRAGVSKPTDAWQLTPSGVEWLLNNRERLGEAFQAELPGLKKGQAQRVRDRIANSELYGEYARTGRVENSPFAFADLVEASPDADKSVIQRHFDELSSQVRLLRDPDLQRFLDRCAQTHGDMLIRGGNPT